MKDDVDRLIDGALAVYGDAEPLSGLEERVMQRVRAAEAARKRRRWWALAVPVTAAVLIAVLARKPDNAVPPPARALVPPVVATVQPLAAPPMVAARRVVRPRSHATRALPKKDLFPTPTPLSREERLLVQLAESHPAELMARPVEQIEIKPIEIAPLQIDGGQ